MLSIENDIDHINVKLFAQPGTQVDFHSLIPIFHRWIQQQKFPELLPFDVADYSHVPAGPGVMLIGHHATISLDNRQGRLGLLFNQRTTVTGSLSDKLRRSFESSIEAARLLAAEPELRNKLTFDESKAECFVNDRLLAPNTFETWERFRPAIDAVFPEARATWVDNPRELFRIHVDGITQNGLPSASALS